MNDNTINNISNNENAAVTATPSVSPAPSAPPPASYNPRYRMTGAVNTPPAAFAPPQPVSNPNLEPDFIPPPGYFVDSAGRLRKDRRKTDRRFNRFVAAVLIICIIGAPFAGLGIGMGIRFFDRYLIVRLLDDSAQRDNFAFENIHTPLGTHNEALDLAALVELVKPSTVLITALGSQPSGRNPFGFGGIAPHAGSGIIFYETDSRIYIATNAHVIEDAQTVVVSINGSGMIPAVPVGRDDAEDLAVIAVYRFEAAAQGIANVTVARFGDSDVMRVGNGVIAIGNSMGEGNTVTDGIVSAVNREIRVAGRILLVLQTNAAINRGNSGGALINMNGEVIGINTAKFTEELAEGMGYAIPSNIAKPVLTRLMHEYTERGGLSRPMIGVDIVSLTPEIAEELTEALIRQGLDADEFHIPDEGIWINGVGRDSPANQAGLHATDIITAVNGISVSTSADFIAITSEMAVGDTIVVSIIRMGSEEMEITVTLGPPIHRF